MLTVDDVVEAVSAMRSSWGRADVVQAICDRQRPVSQLSGHRWADAIERAADLVLDHCVDLDPAEPADRRASDGRSVWIEPTAPRFTSEAVLAEEEFIVSWAMDAQADPPARSTTVNRSGLDVLQAHAAAAVAGEERLVLVVGPAGAGKTRTLTAAVDDLHRHGRHVFGVAPTAKAARTLERDTGMRSDTVAKLLHEWQAAGRPPLPEFQLGAGATVIVDEAGMLTTPALHQLVCLADAHHWRLALVGDHRQLQGVGRGGLLAELCRNGRVVELERVHRFTHDWEAAASLLLRAGDPRAFDAYEAHGRIIAGTLDSHLERMAAAWLDSHERGDSIGLVASSNEHVDMINQAVQAARLASGDLRGIGVIAVAGGELACTGDVVATRRNDRRLLTSSGEPVRNRDTWTVTGTSADGSLSVSHQGGHGVVTLPSDYVSEHVRLGYAATEHGYQSDTVTTAMALVSPTTTSRGLYVGATRGRDGNDICVITKSDDVAEARDVLDAIVALDRADIPAVTQRRTLAQQQRAHEHAPAAPVTPRCVIPDWFEPLVATIRRELDDAERRLADNAAERARRQAALDDAEHRYQQVTHQTQPERDALADARRAGEQARLNLDAAQRRLDAVGLRGRRHARQEHAVAQRRAGPSRTLARTGRASDRSSGRGLCARTQQRRTRPNRPPPPRPRSTARPLHRGSAGATGTRHSPRHLGALGQRRHDDRLCACSRRNDAHQTTASTTGFTHSATRCSPGPTPQTCGTSHPGRSLRRSSTRDSNSAYEGAQWNRRAGRSRRVCSLRAIRQREGPPLRRQRCVRGDSMCQRCPETTGSDGQRRR